MFFFCSGKKREHNRKLYMNNRLPILITVMQFYMKIRAFEVYNFTCLHLGYVYHLWTLFYCHFNGMENNLEASYT